MCIGVAELRILVPPPSAWGPGGYSATSGFLLGTAIPPHAAHASSPAGPLRGLYILSLGNFFLLYVTFTCLCLLTIYVYYGGWACVSQPAKE